MSKLIVVVGGQFGSEGKGALTAWLVRRQWRAVLAVRVAGPNAGHTAYDDDGREFKLQQIPVAAVAKAHAPGQITLAIAAGSEIDWATLSREREALLDAKHDHPLFIDAQATMIELQHMVEERGAAFVGVRGEMESVGVTPLAHGEGGLTKRIGSTGKGVGAARAARIMREAKLFNGGIDVAKMIRGALGRDHIVIVEGTQGYGLGLHAGFYPYCTSSDCRAIDFMAMAGVNPWQADHTEIWMAIRPHPIRVAGDSGPLRNETTWERLGLDPEFTTVTKKMRRVGAFDPILVKDAILANGGSLWRNPGRPDLLKVALMFGDYLDQRMRGKEIVSRDEFPVIRQYEEEIDHVISAVGTGPRTVAEVVN